jgi:ferredoxin-type protein NapG
MGCRECVDACSYEAMSIESDHVPAVDENVCNGCGACEFACISLSAGSLSVGATDRAIVVQPQEKRNVT